MSGATRGTASITGNVSLAEATEAFSCLLADRCAPAFHPEYVLADAFRDEGLTPGFFVYRAGGQVLYHAFHVGLVPGTDYSDIQSPYGYGGPASSTEDPEFQAEAWTAYIEWCRDRRVLAELIRFHPVIENWRYYRGDVLDDRVTIRIDLTAEDLLASYSSRRRGDIRKASREGLSITWERDDMFLYRFIPLYEEMLQARKAGGFYRFPHSYYKALLASDLAMCATCLRGDEVLAVAIFLLHGSMLEYHLSASSKDGQRLGAASLLIHEAGLRAKQSGCRVFHLGGGSDASPTNSLLFFKAGFSNNTAAFKIGRYVHLPAAYAELRLAWEKTRGEVASKVLFYRF